MGKHEHESTPLMQGKEGPFSSTSNAERFGKQVFRVPQEPDPVQFSDRKGVDLPIGIDFPSDGSPMDNRTLRGNLENCIQVGLALTNPSAASFDNGISNYFGHIMTKTVPIPMERLSTSMSTTVESSITTTIRVESVQVKGSPNPDLVAVRHIARFRGLNPKFLFDVYNRLSYTDAIDKYTYLVEEMERFDVTDDMRRSLGVNWCHVAYTADRIFPFFSVRDFTTFDFVCEPLLLQVSRSCTHPVRPETPPPTMTSGCCTASNLRKSSSSDRGSLDERTYRVPLIYFLRILPDPDDPENGCTVVQFQYSDVGGVVPPDRQVEAVIEFGLDSIPKFFATVLRAQQKGLDLGPGSKGYMEDPLEPTWRQDVREMVPGLE